MIGLIRFEARWLFALGCGVLAFLLLPASQAMADLTVSLSGAGTGTVTSEPAGIECSNTPGAEKETAADCVHAFPIFTTVKLTAIPDSGDVLLAWAGSSGGTCGVGRANPCEFSTGFGGTWAVQASFVAAPNPPVAVTGSASVGAEDHLRRMEGTVDPEEFAVSDCYFEYGPTDAYGAKTACIEPAAGELDEASTAPESVHASTEPLEPGSLYHYRLVAANAGGVGRGEDRTFMAPSPPDPCPNAVRRGEQGIGTIMLPACMALEQVSPSLKYSQPARNPEISADGSRIRFKATGELGEAPNLPSAVGNEYVATRESLGWETAATAPPAEQADGLGAGNAAVFTPGLSRWLHLSATASDASLGIGQAFQNGIGQPFEPLSPQLVPLANANIETVQNTTFLGASPDLSHAYLRPGKDRNGGHSIAYLAGDPEPTAISSEANVYVARLSSSGDPDIELVARDADGKVWGGSCGARLGGIGPEDRNALAVNGERNQGAISSDGTRTYFSARASQSLGAPCNKANKLRIMRRIETPQGPWIAELFHSECAREAPEPACKNEAEANGDDRYQGASIDGRLVYLTTNRQLASSDLDGTNSECNNLAAVAGCDLYLYDASLPAGHKLIQISAGENVGGHEKGKEARVYGTTTAISADGSHVYFVAQGVLTSDANPEGQTAVSGQPNLYLWTRGDEKTAFIGTLNNGDAQSNSASGLWGGEGTFSNEAYPVPATGRNGAGEEVGGDGQNLVFESQAPLTGDDTDGTHLDVFRYDSGADPPTLRCISCLPDGAADHGPFDVVARGGERRRLLPDFAEQERWVSEDAKTIVFVTAEGLLPGDLNGAKDSYLWRDGRLSRLPGTADPDGKLQDTPVVSHDGNEVAFKTYARLLPSDGDSTSDVYVARAGGGFPFSSAVTPCAGEGCQQHSTQGPATVPGSADLASAGNMTTPRDCGSTARRAQRLLLSVKRLHRQVRRVSSPRKAKRLEVRAARRAKKARYLSSGADGCRHSAGEAGR